MWAKPPSSRCSSGLGCRQKVLKVSTKGSQNISTTSRQRLRFTGYLPGISGIEALKLLREAPMTAHIPVVALSANAKPRDIQKGLRAGFFKYLTKPIKVDEFMSSVDSALEFAGQAARQSK